VRVGGLITAFIKISPPDLSLDLPQRPGIVLQQSKRDAEFNEPGDVIGNLRLNQGWQGMIDAYLTALFGCQAGEIPEAILHPGGIDNVGGQHCSAAVELKVEVTAVGFWLDEKFNAAVLVNSLLKEIMDTADIAIPDAEKPM